jgi:hypothetical protein
MADQDAIDDAIARFEATFQPLIERNDEERHVHGV